MDLPTLQAVLRDAVTGLILEHWELHDYDVGERTVTSQLFRYMSEHHKVPPHLRVDHEYNRHEGATKTIRSRIGDDYLDPPGERRVYPDVILHRRGDDLEHWLVLEAKRGASCDGLDRIKVKALIEQYGYRWGALLAFGLDTDGWHPRCEWIGPDGTQSAERLFSNDDLEDLNNTGKENWDRRRAL